MSVANLQVFCHDEGFLLSTTFGDCTLTGSTLTADVGSCNKWHLYVGGALLAGAGAQIKPHTVLTR